MTTVKYNLAKLDNTYKMITISFLKIWKMLKACERLNISAEYYSFPGIKYLW